VDAIISETQKLKLGHYCWFSCSILSVQPWLKLNTMTCESQSRE